MTTSRPPSVALLASSANRPTLQEILSNTAPPPWTLSAFMAYLSQNHCLETLEFTMEAERYRRAYAQALGGGMSWMHDANDQMCALWQKLINAYIQPAGPREVNLPGPVRDRLLSFDGALSPPNPSELDEAVTIVYELMNDSVLLPFLESMSACHPEMVLEDDEQEPRQGRSRLRIPKDSSPSNEESSRSPKTSFLPQLSMGRRSDGQNRSASSSTDAADRVGLTDDSGNSTPPAGEPLTPPTTPPTSDWAFSTSPGGLHRAISAHNNSWKRMSAKLGLSRKGRSGRRGNTSNASPSAASPDCEDLTMSDVSSSTSNPL